MSASFRHPDVSAFYKHWDDLRKGDLAPHSRRFLDSPPFALMRSTLILEVHPQGLLVRFMGTALVQICQQDFTGLFFNTAVEPEWSERICDDVRTICDHPVGARVISHSVTTKARKIESEAICLPLAVDPDQPPRCVQFRETGENLNFDEHKVSLGWAKAPDWIDIGAGLP